MANGLHGVMRESTTMEDQQTQEEQSTASNEVKNTKVIKVEDVAVQQKIEKNTSKNLETNNIASGPIFSVLMRNGEIAASDLVIARSNPYAGVGEFANHLRHSFPTECENVFNGFLVEDYFDSSHIRQYSRSFLQRVLQCIATPNNMRIMTFSFHWASINENFLKNTGFSQLASIPLVDKSALFIAVERLFSISDIETYGRVFLMHAVNHLKWAKAVFDVSVASTKPTAQQLSESTANQMPANELHMSSSKRSNQKVHNRTEGKDGSLNPIKTHENHQLDASEQKFDCGPSKSSYRGTKNVFGRHQSGQFTILPAKQKPNSKTPQISGIENRRAFSQPGKPQSYKRGYNAVPHHPQQTVEYSPTSPFLGAVHASSMPLSRSPSFQFPSYDMTQPHNYSAHVQKHGNNPLLPPLGHQGRRARNVSSVPFPDSSRQPSATHSLSSATSLKAGVPEHAQPPVYFSHPGSRHHSQCFPPEFGALGGEQSAVILQGGMYPPQNFMSPSRFYVPDPAVSFHHNQSHRSFGVPPSHMHHEFNENRNKPFTNRKWSNGTRRGSNAATSTQNGPARKNSFGDFSGVGRGGFKHTAHGEKSIGRRASDFETSSGLLEEKLAENQEEPSGTPHIVDSTPRRGYYSGWVPKKDAVGPFGCGKNWIGEMRTEVPDLWVHGLPKEYSQEELEDRLLELFGTKGKVEEVTVRTDRNEDPFSFIRYERVDDARNALGLDQENFLGSKITVQVAMKHYMNRNYTAPYRREFETGKYGSQPTELSEIRGNQETTTTPTRLSELLNSLPRNYHQGKDPKHSEPVSSIGKGQPEKKDGPGSAQKQAQRDHGMTSQKTLQSSQSAENCADTKSKMVSTGSPEKRKNKNKRKGQPKALQPSLRIDDDRFNGSHHDQDKAAVSKDGRTEISHSEKGVETLSEMRSEMEEEKPSVYVRENKGPAISKNIAVHECETPGKASNACGSESSSVLCVDAHSKTKPLERSTTDKNLSKKLSTVDECKSARDLEKLTDNSQTTMDNKPIQQVTPIVEKSILLKQKKETSKLDGNQLSDSGRTGIDTRDTTTNVVTLLENKQDAISGDQGADKGEALERELDSFAPSSKTKPRGSKDSSLEDRSHGECKGDAASSKTSTSQNQIDVRSIVLQTQTDPERQSHLATSLAPPTTQAPLNRSALPSSAAQQTESIHPFARKKPAKIASLPKKAKNKKKDKAKASADGKEESSTTASSASAIEESQSEGSASHRASLALDKLAGTAVPPPEKPSPPVSEAAKQTMSPKGAASSSLAPPLDGLKAPRPADDGFTAAERGRTTLEPGRKSSGGLPAKLVPATPILNLPAKQRKLGAAAAPSERK